MFDRLRRYGQLFSTFRPFNRDINYDLWLENQFLLTIRYNATQSTLQSINGISDQIGRHLLSQEAQSPNAKVSIQPFKVIRQEQEHEIAEALVSITDDNIRAFNLSRIPLTTQFDSHSLDIIGLEPNWYVISADGRRVHGEGGSSINPVSYNASNYVNPPYRFNNLHIQGDGKDVSVYILDNAPPLEKLKAQDWVQNSHMQRMLSPGRLGWTRITDTGMSNINDQFAYMNKLISNSGSTRQPHYIPDHGLFVAGLIDSLAPEAKIYMIEVLNKYGIGTSYTIRNGLRLLEDLIQQDANTKIIVNCSFVLAMPPLIDRNIPQRQKHMFRFLLSVYNNSYYQLAREMEELAQRIMNISGKEVIFFAAAGNDGINSFFKKPTRYPAALNSYIGVGALSSNNTRAYYSNVADRNAGFLVFGGDAIRNYAHHDKGILGLYTADEISGSRNSSGWARWAGTSFSTAILSGLAARIASSSANNTIEEMRDSLLNSAALEEEHLIRNIFQS